MYPKIPFAFVLSLAVAGSLCARSKSLLGGIKTIPLDANGTIPGAVVSTDMGQGSYVKGASKVVVPLIAVAFESSAKASITKSSGGGASIKTKSLESHLLVDEKVLQSIADQLQAIVEKDLAAQGFEVLPKESVDQDARVSGIVKDGQTGVEMGDNFMAGFAGNGVYNRWYTAGQRPLFGTGATGALAHTSPLIRTARDVGKTLLFYRFKVQYTEMDAQRGFFISDVKGKNVLHMLSADVSVFTPAHTLGTMLKLKANITGSADYVQEMREMPKDQADRVGLQMGAVLSTLLSGNATTASSGKSSGHYAIVADADRYEAGSLALLKAVSAQFAQALRKAQG